MSGGGGVDPELERFVKREQEKAQLQNVIHELNEKCWDTCMEGKAPYNKLDGRTESCLKNCVDRFLDTNIMVTKRLEEKASKLMSEHDQMAN